MGGGGGGLGLQLLRPRPPYNQFVVQNTLTYMGNFFLDPDSTVGEQKPPVVLVRFGFGVKFPKDRFSSV